MAEGFRKVVRDAQVYSERVIQLVVRTEAHTQLQWMPPDANVVKLNTDAHITRDNPAGLGCVFRDDRGQILQMGVKRMNVKWAAEEGECAAVLFGLEMAVEAGFRNVVLECDSLTLVNKIKANTGGRSPTDFMIEDIRFLLNVFISIDVNHVSRVVNSVAHSVARLLPENGSEEMFYSSLPSSILDLGRADLV